MIRLIKLVNCQSWEDGVIPLAQDRITVLRADNNSGKSVFFKMLKMTACPNYYTPKERKKLIRNGCESASIIYAFDDNSIGICSVFPTRVLYMYAEDGKSFQKFLEPPQELIDRLGIVHNADKFIANIIDMDQSLLLVDSNVYENYELIKLLTEHPELNELKNKLQINIGDFDSKASELNAEKFELEQLLNEAKYEDVDKMQANITLAENYLNTLENVDDLLEILKKVEKNCIDFVDFDSLYKQLDCLEMLNYLFSVITQITFKTRITQEHVNAIDSFTKLMSTLAKVTTPKEVDYETAQLQMSVLSALSNFSEEITNISIPSKINFDKISMELKTSKNLENLNTVLNQIHLQTRVNLLEISSELKNAEVLTSLKGLFDLIGFTDNDYEIEMQHYNTLVKLITLEKTIKSIKCTVDNSDASEKMLNTLNVLHTLAQQLYSIETNWIKLSESAINIKSLQEKIKTNRTVIDCPTFGKVLYDGQQCWHDVLEEV